ncbi:MAG: hypothetical protein FWH41_01085 [Treponema sp.]|nr:hypothetical protein [Treponema sp.]
MGDDKIFFKINSFSNISQNPFDYKDNPDFSFVQNGSLIIVENEQIQLCFSAAIQIEYFDKKTNEKVDIIKECNFDVFELIINNNLESLYQKLKEFNKKEIYHDWNLELLTVKEATELSGLGKYIGRSLNEILNEFPNADIIKEDFLSYANEPEYCFISFQFKDNKAVEISFLDDYY